MILSKTILVCLLSLLCSACSVPEIIAYQKLHTWYSNITDTNLGHDEPICKPQDPQHKEMKHCSSIKDTKCTACCESCGDYRTDE